MAGPDTVERLTLSQVWVATLVIVSSLFSALGPQWGELSLRSGPGKTLLETLSCFLGCLVIHAPGGLSARLCRDQVK